MLMLLVPLLLLLAKETSFDMVVLNYGIVDDRWG